MTTTSRILEQLRRFETRNVLHIDPAVGWPIVWSRAKGVNVWDPEGRKYLDLTAAFGVAAAGHANPRVVAAGQRQMGTLLHAMGDVHPHAGKAQLARELSRLTYERWSRRDGHRATGKVTFCNSGFEAVEVALKTSMLATGKPGVIAFHGAYHGLGYGALSMTHRKDFHEPFRRQLGRFGHFAPFPADDVPLESALAETETAIRKSIHRHPIGAVLVEPVQGRGGMRIPPAGFLQGLRTVCNETGTLLILDEIYTGFGRTGRWFACEHERVIPDLICLGKALTGGFPLSACVGEATLMDRAWPASNGEALHTSTFLGHPVGCAMALAQIKEIRRLISGVPKLGHHLLESFRTVHPSAQARGIGLMAGLDLSSQGNAAGSIVMRAVQEMLRRGFILLPDGDRGQVIGLTPPLCITEAQISRSARALADVLRSLLSQPIRRSAPPKRQ